MGRMRRVVGSCAVAAVAMMLIASCGPTVGGVTSSRFTQIDPALTGPEIRHETINLHYAITPAGTPRHQLVVLFNGTGAGPLALQTLGATLANDGYNVIGLKYESAVGTGSACPDSVGPVDPDCYRRFRSEVVFGGGVADPTGAAYDQAGMTVSAGNSVENRLLKLVEYLRTTQPLGGWDTFQQRDVGGACTAVNTTYGACELDWSTVISGGHSQGAGVALYLSKFFPVDRVTMLSGPFDAYPTGPGTFAVAPWITEAPLLVPSDRITTLSHLQDPAIGRFRAVDDALGIAGPEVKVNLSPRPFGGVHRLTTDVIPACFLDTTSGHHNSTATDACSPVDAHTDAWRYMATGS